MASSNMGPNPTKMTPKQKADYLAQQKAISQRQAQVAASKVPLPDTSKMTSKQYTEYLKKFVVGKK